MLPGPRGLEIPPVARPPAAPRAQVPLQKYWVPQHRHRRPNLCNTWSVDAKF